MTLAKKNITPPHTKINTINDKKGIFIIS